MFQLYNEIWKESLNSRRINEACFKWKYYKWHTHFNGCMFLMLLCCFVSKIPMTYAWMFWEHSLQVLVNARHNHLEFSSWIVAIVSQNVSDNQMIWQNTEISKLSQLIEPLLIMHKTEFAMQNNSLFSFECCKYLRFAPSEAHL